MLLKWFSDNLAFCIFTMFHKRCQASFGHPAGMYVCMHVHMSFKLFYAKYCSKII